jgi:hypothetical protein
MMAALALACAFVGDSIVTREGLGQFFPECEVVAEVGRSTRAMLGTVPPVDVVVISAGSNDDPEGQLRVWLYQLRNEAPGIVVWIAPAEENRAQIIYDVAAMNGDAVVRFEAGTDGVHPRSYSALARDVRFAIAAANL